MAFSKPPRNEPLPLPRHGHCRSTGKGELNKGIEHQILLLQSLIITTDTVCTDASNPSRVKSIVRTTRKRSYSVMASTTTDTSKVKKRAKKGLGSKDYDFGPTTSFTARSTDEAPPRWFRQMNENLLSQNVDLSQHVQMLLDDLRNNVLKTQEENSKEMKLQQATIERQQTVIEDQQASIDTLSKQNASLKSSIDTLMTKPATAPTSYAAITSSFLPPSPPSTRSPSPRPETTSCIIDLQQMNEEEKTPLKIRQSIESEVQKELGTVWKCTAVLRDRPNRLKIVCNTKEELEKVKKATTTTIPRAKVASDPLYPIKIDNVRTSSVLHPDGTVKDIKDMLSEENNNAEIARLGWLSAKQTGKAFGSMVIYLIKKSEAQRILQKGFFDVCGESAYARVFERHPPKCFSCQKEGHIARNCTEPATESGEMDSTN